MFRFIISTIRNIFRILRSSIMFTEYNIIFNGEDGSVFKIGTAMSEGIDLPIIDDSDVIIILPREFYRLKHGLTIIESNNCYCEIWPRSSASKYGLMITSGVVDSDYRGQIMTVVYNTTDKSIILSKINGSFPAVSQLLIKRVFRNNSINSIKIGYNHLSNRILHSDQIRGTGGFGSTGR